MLLTHERSVTMPILPRVLQAKIELSATWLKAQTEAYCSAYRPADTLPQVA
jgi:hypothetical protein